MIAARFRIDTDHPSLPGHFPGRPVVPGVVLLEETLARLHDGPPGAWRIDSAKFLSPVLPGEEVVVNAERRSDGRLAFTCHVGDRLVVRGLAVFET